MGFGNIGVDKTILKDVNKKLLRTGVPCKITATVNSGAVTLTGALQYENQRRAILRAAQTTGVRQVVDRMIVKPKKRPDAQ